MLERELRALLRSTHEHADRLVPDSLLREWLSEHGLDQEAPAWMVEFVRKIANGETTPELLNLPSGYPLGENGLTNLLADIQNHVEIFDIVDTGEDFTWRSPATGVCAFIQRESTPMLGAIRPISEPISDWWPTQLAKHRQGRRNHHE